MPLPIENMADVAVGAIVADLRIHHDLNDKEVEAIRNGFVDRLKIADALNRYTYTSW